MYTPQIPPQSQNRPARERPRVESVSRPRADFGDARRTAAQRGVRLPVARDHLNITDETRLRAEYALRLTQEAKRLQQGQHRSPSPDDTARAYVSLLDDIRASFRPDTDSAPLHIHLDALRGAWDDVLTTLAQKAALCLGAAARQGGARAGFDRSLAEAHHLFAARFCALYPANGVERALVLAKEGLAHSAAFDRNGAV
ncbi:MAG: hypothetical protein LBH86_01265 [Oscillospiraceae bacterium]|jgi:hypothetical protein|nr:hypothetical protein [Oscillospiraceae bacterium]